MKKAAVLGYPITHSLSPKLHGYWLKQYGIEGSYEAIEVKPGELAETFERLKNEGYSGWNVTVPYKEEALALLGKENIDPIAWQIGAINTVEVLSDGTLKGYNTDAFGFIQNLIEKSNAVLKDKHVMVIGAGGASRAVLAGLLKENVASISITNRTLSKSESLVNYFGKKVQIVPWDEKEEALSEQDFLINTTSLGMQGQPRLEINIGKLPKNAIVNDIVYKPLHTELLKLAKVRGHQIVDGIGMLIWQAVPGFEMWFGTKPEVTPELKTYMLSLC